MVEFSQHVKTDFLNNAEQILVERRLMQHITTQEGYGSRQVGFLFQDDARHWIVCGHGPAGGEGGTFSVSALPKRHYTIDHARKVLDKTLGDEA